jgi:hypothetical protein
MSIPDFGRAEYNEPRVIEGEVVGLPPRRGVGSAFPLALLYGFAAAIVGSLGYGLVSSTGFMISIVAIGIGWLVARSMMTATGGVGNQSCQIAATALTYFAVTAGNLIHPLWKAHEQGFPASIILMNPLLLKYLLIGPLIELQGGLNGILGLVILFFGLRTAWKMAAGSPGFQRGQTARVGPFGPR